jgi:hypothetical protein
MASHPASSSPPRAAPSPTGLNAGAAAGPPAQTPSAQIAACAHCLESLQAPPIGTGVPVYWFAAGVGSLPAALLQSL